MAPPPAGAPPRPSSMEDAAIDAAAPSDAAATPGEAVGVVAAAAAPAPPPPRRHGTNRAAMLLPTIQGGIVGDGTPGGGAVWRGIDAAPHPASRQAGRRPRPLRGGTLAAVGGRLVAKLNQQKRRGTGDARVLKKGKAGSIPWASPSVSKPSATPALPAPPLAPGKDGGEPPRDGDGEGTGVPQPLAFVLMPTPPASADAALGLEDPEGEPGAGAPRALPRRRPPPNAASGGARGRFAAALQRGASRVLPALHVLQCVDGSIGISPCGPAAAPASPQARWRQYVQRTQAQGVVSMCMCTGPSGDATPAGSAAAANAAAPMGNPKQKKHPPTASPRRDRPVQVCSKCDVPHDGGVVLGLGAKPAGPYTPVASPRTRGGSSASSSFLSDAPPRAARCASNGGEAWGCTPPRHGDEGDAIDDPAGAHDGWGGGGASGASDDGEQWGGDGGITAADDPTGGVDVSDAAVTPRPREALHAARGQHLHQRVGLTGVQRGEGRGGRGDDGAAASHPRPPIRSWKGHPAKRPVALYSNATTPPTGGSTSTPPGIPALLDAGHGRSPASGHLVGDAATPPPSGGATSRWVALESTWADGAHATHAAPVPSVAVGRHHHHHYSTGGGHGVPAAVADAPYDPWSASHGRVAQSNYDTGIEAVSSPSMGSSIPLGGGVGGSGGGGAGACQFVMTPPGLADDLASMLGIGAPAHGGAAPYHSNDSRRRQAPAALQLQGVGGASSTPHAHSQQSQYASPQHGGPAALGVGVGASERGFSCCGSAGSGGGVFAFSFVPVSPSLPPQPGEAPHIWPPTSEDLTTLLTALARDVQLVAARGDDADSGAPSHPHLQRQLSQTGGTAAARASPGVAHALSQLSRQLSQASMYTIGGAAANRGACGPFTPGASVRGAASPLRALTSHLSRQVSQYTTAGAGSAYGAADLAKWPALFDRGGAGGKETGRAGRNTIPPGKQLGASPGGSPSAMPVVPFGALEADGSGGYAASGDEGHRMKKPIPERPVGTAPSLTRNIRGGMYRMTNATQAHARRGPPVVADLVLAPPRTSGLAGGA